MKVGHYSAKAEFAKKSLYAIIIIQILRSLGVTVPTHPTPHSLSFPFCAPLTTLALPEHLDLCKFELFCAIFLSFCIVH